MAVVHQMLPNGCGHGRRAAAKLAKVLPPKLRRQVSMATAGTLPFALSRATGVVFPDCLVIIASACANHDRMRFRYRDNEGAETAPHTEPVPLVASGRRWHLLAFDLDRDDWRTFRGGPDDRPARATGTRATSTHSPHGSLVHVDEVP